MQPIPPVSSSRLILTFGRTQPQKEVQWDSLCRP